MKKVLIGFGALVFLLVAMLAVLPFVIDVDKFRPQIVSAANEQINGEVRIGKIYLSLWGQIRFVLDDLEVLDQNGAHVVKVGQAYAHLPFSSLWGGEPRLTLRMERPEVNIIKDQRGQMNVLTLVKESEVTEEVSRERQPRETVPEQAEVDDTQEPGTSVLDSERAQPAIEFVKRAGIDIELNNVAFSYQDLESGLLQRFTDLNVHLVDISLSRPMDIRIWSGIETKLGEDLTVRGPFEFTGRLTPELEGLDFKNLQLEMFANFDDITILVPETFEKKKGEPANLEIRGSLALNAVELDRIAVRFLDTTADATLSLTNLDTPPDERLSFKLKADKPGVDLDLDVNLVSISKPNIRIRLESNELDFDTLFPPSPEAIERREQEKRQAEQRREQIKRGERVAEVEPEEPPFDVDGALAPVRESEFLGNLGVTAAIRMNRFTGFNVEVNDIAVDASFRDLQASLSRLSLAIFGGHVNMSAGINLKPERPNYQFNSEVKDLDLNKALISQLEMLTNTLSGVLSFKVTGRGESLNTDLLLANLNATGNFKVTDATFRTMDIIDITTTEVNSALDQIRSDIPGLGDRRARRSDGGAAKYQEIGAQFTISEGSFEMPNFRATSLPRQGVDIHGVTRVGLTEDSLFARWSLVDTHNQTGLGDVSVSAQGVSVNNIFSDKGAPVSFPVEVGCKLSEPCFKFEALPQHLLGLATSNIKGAASDAIQRRLDEERRRLQERADAERQRAEQRLAEERSRLEERRKQEEQKARDRARQEAERATQDKGRDLKRRLGF